jgi:hypothetical protein
MTPEKDRYEILFEHAKHWNERRNVSDLLKIKREIELCSFHPQTNKHKFEDEEVPVFKRLFENAQK